MCTHFSKIVLFSLIFLKVSALFVNFDGHNNCLRKYYLRKNNNLFGAGASQINMTCRMQYNIRISTYMP